MTSRSLPVLLTVFLVAGFVSGAAAAWLFFSQKQSGEDSGTRSQIVSQTPSGSEARGEIAGTEPEDLFHSLAETQALSSREEGEKRLSQLVDRWLTRSPSEAFRAIYAYPETAQRQFLLNRIVAAWASEEPAAALAAIEGIEDGALRQELVVAALKETDPRGALDLLEAIPAKQRPELYASIFWSWATQDADAATARLVSMSQLTLRSSAIEAMAQALAESNPTAAFVWADSLENRVERVEALLRAIEVARDPLAALKGLPYLDASSRKQEAIEHLIRKWARTDPHAALKWARENTEGVARSKALADLASRFVRSDPRTATSILEELPAGKERSDGIAGLAGTWGRLSPDAAFEWSESLEPAERQEAFGRLGSGWAIFDPWDAAAFAATLPEDDPDYDVFRQATTSEWANVEPEQALAWAASLSGDAGLELHRRTIGQFASDDPLPAAAYVEGLEDPDQRREFAAQVVGRWMDHNPSGAAAWADRMLDPSTQAAEFGRLADRWSRWDPLEASKWVGSMEESPGRDAAVDALVKNIGAADPDGAAAWAETISDAALRESWRARLKE